MRVTTAAGFLVAAGTLVLVGVWTVTGVATPCRDAVGCVTDRLPAPITVTDGRVSYRIAAGGGATRVPAPRGPYPQGAIWFPGTGTWYRIARRHLVVGRGRRLLWRSRAEIGRDQLGVVAAGPSGVAFEQDHGLYVASVHGTARPVGRRELPLGWTTGGLFVYSYPRRELLLLHDEGGAISKTIGRRPREYAYDLAGRRLYFLSGGVLMEAHGARTRRLGVLSRLGGSANVELQPLGDGWLELLDNRRLTVLRPNGSAFALTSVRRLDRISSFLAIAADRGTVAFTGVTGPATHPGGESVFVLRAGSRRAAVVHRAPGPFGGCGQWASVEWHGSWLLYSNTGGNLAAIDTTGAHRTIPLSGLADALLGARKGFNAHWSR
ncbi:MAG TPA: hypothetical protein VE127_07620 [Solirubrobacteraceae bacterium]|nr:hypothetical protein [Solirubrobacteraceae bacterium]